VKFLKKAKIIDAVRWMDNDDPAKGYVGNDHAATFLGSAFINITDANTLNLRTPTGPSVARRGDWLCFQVLPNGDADFWPVSDESFRMAYEPTPESMFEGRSRHSCHTPLPAMRRTTRFRRHGPTLCKTFDVRDHHRSMRPGDTLVLTATLRIGYFWPRDTVHLCE
jgi:hypothetical protein